MSGPKIAALYGLIPNKLGFCGLRQELLKKFIIGKLPIAQVIPVLEKFEAAYAYYQLIARKNKISSPFNKKVVEAYWLGNKLLDKFRADDLRKLIMERFCQPGLLSKKDAEARAGLIPENSKPHHSFHVLILGSITGSVDFTSNTKLKDTCRIGWGRVSDLKKDKMVVNYAPLTGKKFIKLSKPIKKIINWDKEILPSVDIGDWVSFHWNYAIQKLNKENIVNLHKYTQNTLDTLHEKNRKPTIAIVSLTCCEGCQVAILDLGARFLQLTEHIKIGDFAFLEDAPEAPNYDIIFVEGAPITEANIDRLKDLRARSRVLVALGACAAMGGIAEIKNHQDKNERMRYVYKNFEGINNPDIKPLSHYVTVDWEIPGCPINKEEFLKIVKQLLAGVPPAIAQRPVCYECQIKQNECLLQEGLPCLGPIMLAGCGAPCPSNNYPCDGCRGPLKNIDPDNLNKQLTAQGYLPEEINLILQRFGIQDKIYPDAPIKE